VRQDLFIGCFNISQERKEKVATKGLTLNANMDKFVERIYFFTRQTLYGCKQFENCV